MVLSRVQVRLLRLGVILRVLLVCLAGLTQLTRVALVADHHPTPTHAQQATEAATAASTTALPFDWNTAHYDASAQLAWLEYQRQQQQQDEDGHPGGYSSCSHLGWVQRGLLGGLSWTHHWDGLHFARTAQHAGRYDVEKETAFFPGLPMAVRWLAGPSHAWVCPYLAHLLAAALLSTVCFFLNILLLHHLTLLVLGSPALAYTATVCFIFNPAAVFMAAFYTEGPFLTLALLGMVARERRRWLLSALCFAACTCLRANGYLFAGFFVFDAMRTTGLARGQVATILRAWAIAFVTTIIIFFPFLAFQYHLASRFCAATPTDDTRALPPYCQSLLPNVYAHVQSTYWNVGFLRYYELRQLPNFLLALPAWALSACGIATYARANPWRFVSLGIASASSSGAGGGSDSRRGGAAGGGGPTSSSHAGSAGGRSTFASSPRLLVYIYLWLGLLAICVTVLHVQVSTRFLSACCPPAYWFAAHLLTRKHPTSPATDSAGSSGWLSARTLLPLWSASFIVVGTVLFSAFLPWT